jgi:uncharacterized membrane protein
MHTTILAAFLLFSRTPFSMCSASILIFLIALWAARTDVAQACGLDKVVALSNLCFAAPLAVFGALHLSDVGFVLPIVPSYMPWRLFIAYLVGVALLGASLSIATKIQVRWSGLLFGIMMFLFVAMIHLPGAIAQPHNRIIWMIVFREMSFGGAGLILAGRANIGQVFVTAAMLVFGVEHFLHPLGLPGVPLVRQMPAWIPARGLVDYATGAALVAGVVSVVFKRNTRFVLTCAAGWLLLLVLLIYGPVLAGALSESTVAAQVERVNYFADTLLFTGAILALARASASRS